MMVLCYWMLPLMSMKGKVNVPQSVTVRTADARRVAALSQVNFHGADFRPKIIYVLAVILPLRNPSRSASRLSGAVDCRGSVPHTCPANHSRSGARRIGRTRRKAIPKPRHTSGGTGTTNTPPRSTLQSKTEEDVAEDFARATHHDEPARLALRDVQYRRRSPTR